MPMAREINVQIMRERERKQRAIVAARQAAASEGAHAKSLVEVKDQLSAEHYGAHPRDIAAIESLIIRKFRQKGNLRKCFLALDRRGDGRIDADELCVGLARRFDIVISLQDARALCNKYDCDRASWTTNMRRGGDVRTAPRPLRPRFDYSTFCAMHDGSFSSHVSHAHTVASAAHSGVTRAYDFHDEAIDLPHLAPTRTQNASNIITLVGDKLRAHASSSARSRNFASVFLKLDRDRSGMISYDEIALGLAQLGVHLSDRQLLDLVNGLDVGRSGRVNLQKFMLLMQRPGRSAPWCTSARAHHHTSRAAHVRTPSRSLSTPLPIECAELAGAAELPPLEADEAMSALSKITLALADRRLRLRAAFAKFDTHGDGTLSPAEFSAGLARVGVHLTHRRAARLMNAFATPDKTRGPRIKFFEFVRMLSSSHAVAKQPSHVSPRKAVAAPRTFMKTTKSSPTNYQVQQAYAHPAPEVSSDEELEVDSDEESGSDTDDEMEDFLAVEADAAKEEAKLQRALQSVAARVYSRFRRVRDAFIDFDSDGGRNVTPAELVDAMRRGSRGSSDVMAKLSEAEARALIARFDLNGSGGLGLSEFVKLLGAAASHSGL